MQEVVLKYPIQNSSGKEINALHFRRPKLRDYKQAQNMAQTPADEQSHLLALIAFEDVVPEDLDELDLGDYSAISAWFRQIFDFPESTAAGDTASVAGAACKMVSVSA
jgi:hypothetical protein